DDDWTEWTAIADRGVETATVDGLSGIAQVFQLRAVTIALRFGTSDPIFGEHTSEITVTPFGPPLAPTGFAARGGDQHVELSWTTPFSSGSSVTHYELAQTSGGPSDEGTPTDFGAFERIEGSGADTEKHSVSGLENIRRYAFKIRAVNDLGAGAESVVVSALTAGAPGKPTGLSARVFSRGVLLKWDRTTDTGGVALRGYDIRYRTTGEYATNAWADIGIYNPNSPGVRLSGLAVDVEHFFQVRAVNQAGVAGRPSDEISATPGLAPETPAEFTVTSSVAPVRVEWVVPAAGTHPITRYGLHWANQPRASSRFNVDVDNPPAGLDSASLPLLENGVAQFLSIEACSVVGCSDRSEEITVTPISTPEAPAGLTATAGVESVELSWTAAYDNGGEIDYYEVRFAADAAAIAAAVWNRISGSGADTTSHTEDGLAVGPAYIFQVRAHNAQGDGAAATAPAATPFSVPVDAPTGFAAGRGVRSAVLSWDAFAGDDGGAVVTGYQYRRRAAPGGFGTWVDVAGIATTTATAGGLSNGVEYLFELRAVNAAGGGAATAAVPVRPGTLPGAPQEVTAERGDTVIRLEWSPASSGGLEISYEYRAGEDAAAFVDGDWTAIAGSSATTRSFSVPGLANGVLYFVELRAVNAAGNGPAAGPLSATPVSGVPNEPIIVESLGEDRQVDLAWQAPENAAAAGVTGYEVQYKRPSVSKTFLAWIPVPGGALVKSYAVTGLVNGESYVFRVRATAGAGREGPHSAEVVAVPGTVPGTPRSFEATLSADDAGRVDLSWEAPMDRGDPEFSRYEVAHKRAADSDYGEYVVVAGGAFTTTHRVAGLDADTVYGFLVRVVSAAHPGEPAQQTARTNRRSAEASLSRLRARAAGATRSITLSPESDPIVDTSARAFTATTSEAVESFLVVPTASHPAATITVAGAPVAGGSASAGFDLPEDGSPVSVSVVVTAEDGITTTTYTVTVTRERPARAPGAPTGLAAEFGDGRVVLSWAAPADIGNRPIVRYEYCTKAAAGRPCAEADWEAATTATTTTVGSLANGTEYWFRVRA
ncbi:MAG TPA: hypothetical protein DEP66_05890, partial [Acidimicrobiaceae bacterium]|nr:hypothetical protein [Acidimicrobiaceae bacterium]